MVKTQIADAGAEFDSLFASVAAEESAPSHFTTDCLAIVKAAQASPNAFPGIGALVLCSIRQPFYLMGRQMADVARNGVNARCLFGAKRDGFQFIRHNRARLHRTATEFAAGTIGLDDVIREYLTVPGLGIVKASFLAQMTIGDGACLDTLNLRRMGLAEDAFRLSKLLTVKTVSKKIVIYNTAWRMVGDSAYWWDSWCDAIADRTHNARGAAISGFLSGAHASKLHRIAITSGIK